MMVSEVELPGLKLALLQNAGIAGRNYIHYATVPALSRPFEFDEAAMSTNQPILLTMQQTELLKMTDSSICQEAN